MKVKLFDGFNNIVLMIPPTLVDWLLCGRAVGGGGGGGVGDVVMLADSLDIGDAGLGDLIGVC